MLRGNRGQRCGKSAGLHYLHPQVGQKIPDDERVLLFLKLKPGVALSNALVSAIKLRIRTLLSPRHVPARILQVADIPVTPVPSHY